MHEEKNSGRTERIKYIVSLVVGSGILSGIWTALTCFFADLQPFLWPVIIVIVLAMAIGLLIGWLLPSKKMSKRQAVTPKIDPKYTVKEEYNKFCYGKSSSEFSSKVVLRIEKKGVDQYNGKFGWSGSDAVKLKCRSKNSKIKIVYLEQRDVLTEFYAQFDRNYRRGDKVNFEIYASLGDREHSFAPYFSKRVIDVTEKLILHIVIPPEYKVKEVICEEIAVSRSENDIPKTVELDGLGEYKWVIENPKLYYIYSIRWQFPDGED